CVKDKTQDGLSIRNNASVLGFKGEMKRNGLTAFYKHLLRSHNDEIFAPGSLQTLYYYAGFKGRFGSLKGGTLSTPYKLPALSIDPFYDTSAGARGFDGASFGLSQLSMGFTKNAIAIKSPALMGVSVDVAIIIDDTNADKHDYNAGFRFKSGAFSAGLQHLSLQSSKAVAKSTGEGDATRFWFSYSTKKWSLAGSGEKIFIKGGNNEEHYFLAGTITPVPDLKLAATLGKSNVLDTPVLDGKGSSVGFFYTLVPKFQIFGLFSKLFRDSGLEEREVFSLGMILNFGLSHRN
ncbi:MAG: porin, partial [Nitrospinota bacterium]